MTNLALALRRRRGCNLSRRRLWHRGGGEEAWEPIRVELGRLRLADRDSCFVLLHGLFYLHASRWGHTGVLVVHDFSTPTPAYICFFKIMPHMFLIKQEGSLLQPSH
jgi:hypothetical protein